MPTKPALVVQTVAALTFAALTTLPAPLLANPTDPTESSSFYGNVRNWLIEVRQRDGMFLGCRGTIPLQAAGPLLIEVSAGMGYDALDGWAMYVPSQQAPSSDFGNHVSGQFSVDADELAVQFDLYPGGWASIPLSGEMRQQMRDGNYVSTAPQGEEPRQWILNGSTAALDMLEECYARQGRAY